MENEKIVPINNEEPNEEPKNEEHEETSEKKPGKVKKVALAVTTPIRWCWRKVKNSPAATAVGMVGGAGLALGGRILIKKFLDGREEQELGEEIETEDLGETYADPTDEEAV